MIGSAQVNCVSFGYDLVVICRYALDASMPRRCRRGTLQFRLLLLVGVVPIMAFVALMAFVAVVTFLALVAFAAIIAIVAAAAGAI